MPPKNFGHRSTNVTNKKKIKNPLYCNVNNDVKCMSFGSRCPPPQVIGSSCAYDKLTLVSGYSL